VTGSVDRPGRNAVRRSEAGARTITQQQERIEELESLSVGRAVKFAVGQRLRARKAVDEEGTAR
jgi:hypothetical protein